MRRAFVGRAQAPQELEVWCNNTFTFVPASQVGQHGQDWGQGMVKTEMVPARGALRRRGAEVAFFASTLRRLGFDPALAGTS